MGKAEKRTTPSPQSRAGAGRKRDSAGRFVKGVSGNPGGTKHMPPEMREFARESSLKGMKTLAKLLESETTISRDRIAIVRLFLEYGYGRPAAEFDRERVQMDRERLEMERARVERETDEAAKNKEIRVVLSDDLMELVE